MGIKLCQITWQCKGKKTRNLASLLGDVYSRKKNEFHTVGRFGLRVVVCMGTQKMKDKKRSEMLRLGAVDSGLTIDYLEWLTRGLSRQAARKVIGNASSMPSYMKSSDNPYVSRKERAPSIETLLSPVSQFDT